MALYEYQCDSCGHRFERIQKFSDPPPASCPKCEGPVYKLISSPAFQFKGSGWYATDYAKKSGAPASSEGSAGESKTAAKDAKETTSSSSSTDAGAKDSSSASSTSSTSTPKETTTASGTTKPTS